MVRRILFILFGGVGIHDSFNTSRLLRDCPFQGIMGELQGFHKRATKNDLL